MTIRCPWLMVAIASLSIVAPRPSPGAPRTRDGVLAYLQNGRVYIREIPAGRPIRVTRAFTAEQLHWSPTGRWLLFTQHTEYPAAYWQRCLVVRRDGAGLREVCRSDRAAWVGAGDEIAFEDGGAIWLVSAPDFRRRRLARMPKQGRNHRVSFEVSPDRRHIAFSRWWINWNRDGTEWDRASGLLWVQRPNGSHRRKLYDAHGHFEDLPTIGGWSSDGQHLFMGTWVYHAGSGNLDGTPLYVFDVRTGRRRSLAPHWVMKHYDWYAYSPDGRRLVVMDGGERWWNGEPKVLLTVDARTWRRHRITSPAVDSFFAAWSPDGRRLAYVENRTFRQRIADWDSTYAHNRLCVVDADGSHRVRITREDGYGDIYPMWCADGRQLLFVRTRRGHPSSLWLVRDDGRGLRPLPDGPQIPEDRHAIDSFDFWTPHRGWNHR